MRSSIGVKPFQEGGHDASCVPSWSWPSDREQSARARLTSDSGSRCHSKHSGRPGTSELGRESPKPRVSSKKEAAYTAAHASIRRGVGEATHRRARRALVGRRQFLWPRAGIGTIPRAFGYRRNSSRARSRSKSRSSSSAATHAQAAGEERKDALGKNRAKLRVRMTTEPLPHCQWPGRTVDCHFRSWPTLWIF